MYSIRTKETRGLLVVIMAFVMMFAGVAFIAVDVEAEDPYSAYVSTDGGTEVGYDTIESAISSASSGDTVRIVAGEYNTSMNVNKDGVIVIGDVDPDGNNLVKLNGRLSVTGNNITVKNINVLNTTGNAFYISGNGYFENLNLTGSNGLRYCYANDDVTFKKCVITGSTYGIHFDGSAGGRIVIDGCTITGWTSFARTISEVSITDTSFEEGNYNYIRFYQDATISGCIFNEEMEIDISNEVVDVSLTIQDSIVSYEDGTEESASSIVDSNDAQKNTITVDEEPIISPVPAGFGTEDRPYKISTLGQFVAFAESVNSGKGEFNGSGIYVELASDIDLEEIEWAPIGTKANPFIGKFDGKDNTISNLKVSSGDNVGLFGYINGAALSNITVENASVTGGSQVGVIVGCGYTGSITGCEVTGDVSVSGNYKVGGISGDGYARITDCSVSSENGSIVGYYKSVNLEGDNVGGIVGFLGEGTTVTECDVSIDVSGTRKVGGIVGITPYSSTISSCTYTGKVTIIEVLTDNYSENNAHKLFAGGIIGEVREIRNDAGIDDCSLGQGTIIDGYSDATTGLIIGGSSTATSDEQKETIDEINDNFGSSGVVDFDDKTVVNVSTGNAYMDLAPALEDADSGQTIRVLKDIVLSENVDVEEGVSLEVIEGVHITGDGSINVYGSMYLEAADVRVSVIVHDDDGQDGFVSISKPKKMTVTGDQTADLGVGYGNTLVLKDLDVPSGKYIKAWGTVVIEGTVTVEDSNGFIVYYGGNAQIDGALVIEGGATVNGTAVVNGSVKVYNEDGNASFNVGPKGDVTVLGTMDVLKGKTKNTTNTLAVAATGNLNIEGTLTVTGTMSGMACDMGTVIFNGAATGDKTGFTVYDGVTLTIASVTGTLKITDLNIQDEDYTGSNYVISTGNVVSISNVKNVTVSVILDETSVKENNVSKRLVTSEMTVIGTITSIDEKSTTVDEKIEVVGTAVKPTVNNEIVQGSIILGDITLGKQVVLDIKSGDVDVIGAINAVAETSSIVIGSDAVDVTGTILVGEKALAVTVLNINGATYYIDDDTKTDDKVTYYTTFENALAAIATANEKTVEILGTVEVATELEIPAEATVLVKGALTIDVDGKITVAAGALFDADNATENVDVDGMLVIMDKESGLEGDNKLVYQVYTEAGDVATYSGLVLALRNAAEGDVITVVKAGEIEKSVTIPEGVTLVVPNGSKLTIGSEKDDVILTVAGTLKVEGTVEAADDAQEVEIAVPGTIMEIGSGDIKFDNAATTTVVDGIVMDDYVTFNTKVDGRATVVYSNLAYVAENATEGPVAIYGDVSAGDITFTMGEKAGEFTIGFGKADSTMTVGTMTLVSNGKANIVLATANGAVTGTVASAAGSVDLNKVSGITIAVSIVTDVDGTTDYMTVAGELDGKMSVATGTVTAGALLVGKSVEDVMTVATGATLLVPENKSVTVQTMNLVGTTVKQYYGLTVDGTLSVNKGTVTINGQALVNGDVSIVDTNEVEIDDKLVVIGTITVSSTTEAKYALDVDGKLFIGSAPSIGATGTLVGNADLAGAIISYPGSDLSGAIINDSNNDGVSDIEPTEFYINGQLYMTVYSVSVKDPVIFATGLDIQIPGLVNPQDKTPVEPIVWYIDENMKNVATGATIGSVDKLYTEFDAAEVDLVVSAGVGLKVYIDGLDASEMDDITVGTHTVSFAVESGYDGANATITVNGVQVSNNGTFTVDVDADKITIIASGAVPAQSSGSTVIVDDADDGMALTDILLIVLVVLIVIMAIIVTLRMMRS